MSSLRSFGLTLVEVLVAIAIVGILAAAAAPSVSDLIERRRVMAAAGEVASMLAFAKAQTAEKDVPIDVDINQIYNGYSQPVPMSCMAVTTQSGNNTCLCWLPAGAPCLGGGNPGTMLRSYQLPKSKGIYFDASDTQWIGSMPNRITFYHQLSQLYGLMNGVTIKVRGPKHMLNVVINPAGRVSICSPNGDISGYPVC